MIKQSASWSPTSNHSLLQHLIELIKQHLGKKSLCFALIFFRVVSPVSHQQQPRSAMTRDGVEKRKGSYLS